MQKYCIAAVSVLIWVVC